ncbi:ABC transporter substrate-binding protein [Actinopolymorpha pittospori]|uniref:Multiple sugar transport system substrate-binding protein n=1 Tax=Actinopolymorpha pittospori TaxID=648752 RepID=A0A927N639_9ACTN|nr:ABC transporter substrate-binding protein [Actinopolymorpha pittospori]MBE1609190.1 multiple sugar transport system substrate-binding protein [Actinopolymorpha pittospori]
MVVRTVRTTRRGFIRGAAALATTAAGAFAMNGCGRSATDVSAVSLPRITAKYDGPVVELRFWNGLTGGDGPFMRKLISQFSEQHPNIQIQMYALPWATFYQKFPAAVVSGLAPDFGLMQNFQVATNAARQVIVPLDDLAAEVGLTETDYNDVVWKSGVFKGRRYSIPLDVWPDSLFFNRTVLESAGLDPDSPPRDADDYLAALEALHEKGIAGHWLGSVDQSSGRSFDSLLWQNGGTHYTPDGDRALFNSDEGVAALQWQVDRIRAGHSPASVAGGDANVAFKNGQNAFLWGGPGALINDLNTVKTLDWGVVPLPRIATHAAAFSGSHQLVIMRQRHFDANRLAAAATFIRWLSDNSIGWAEAGPVPARLDVQASARFKKLTAQASVAAGIPDIHFYPLVPGIAEVQTNVLYQAVSQALQLRSTPAQALDLAAEQANALLAENRLKYEGKA